MNTSSLVQSALDSNMTKKRILVVDDNEQMVVFNKEILEMSGYEVRTASCGYAALECLLSNPSFDLILMDVYLDDISGPEFLEILENEHPELFHSVPVVFVSAIDKVPPSKSVGFIKKPYNFKAFLESVDGFLKL